MQQREPDMRTFCISGDDLGDLLQPSARRFDRIDTLAPRALLQTALPLGSSLRRLRVEQPQSSCKFVMYGFINFTEQVHGVLVTAITR